MTESDDPQSPRRSFRRAMRGLVWATPGQLDAGFASLATFGAGIYAVRELSTEALAAYALLFAAFHFANQFSSELFMSPAQILAIDLELSHRLGMLRHSLPLGAGVAGIAAFVVPLGALPVFSVLSPAELIPLVISVAILAAISPIQDHVRAMFHLSSRSWVAAGMSALHLVVTLIAIFAFSRRLPAWTPFGALASGNVASLGFALAVFRRINPPRSARPTVRQFTSIGSWMLFTDLIKNGLGYAGRALLNAFLGAAALGFVEGARVAAQPLNVLALGLMAQVGPRLTEAGSRRDLMLAKRWRTRFYILFGAIALVFIAICAVPWSLNPLVRLTPRAFEIPGLTAAMLVATTINCLLRPFRTELFGARQLKLVTRVAIGTGIVEIALLLAWSLLGTFVVPLGISIAAIVGALVFRRRLKAIYASSSIGPLEKNLERT